MISTSVVTRKRQWESTLKDKNVKRQRVDSRGNVREPPTSTAIVLKKQDKSTEPQNKELYMKRVYTYKPIQWFGKPLECSEFVCSRWGWACVGVNILKCTNCKQVVSFKGNKNVALAYKISIARFRELLQTGHSHECFWKTNPSPESFMYLYNNKIVMEEACTTNLRSFNITDGVTNTYKLPVIVQECREQILKEFPEERATEVTDAMLLSACGWRLYDSRRQSPIQPLNYNNSINNSCQNNNYIFNSDHFRLHCVYCNRSLPLKQYRLRSHNTIIPDTPSLRIHDLRISKEPDISPFSIDNSPPTFQDLKISGGSFHIWDPNYDYDYTRKRKLSPNNSDVEFEDSTTPATKKTCLRTNSVSITKPLNERKRSRNENEDQSTKIPLKKRKIKSNNSGLDTSKYNKKRKMEDVSSNFKSKRLRTNSGGRCFSKAFDPILEHRPSCPYLNQFYYSTGSGEVQGWIHSIRCMQLDPTILRAVIQE